VRARDIRSSQTSGRDISDVLVSEKEESFSAREIDRQLGVSCVNMDLTWGAEARGNVSRSDHLYPGGYGG